MKAMILAAGVGSRLAPLTDSTPKALIEVGGKPLISHVLERLAAAGVRQVIVNTFHWAEKLEAYLQEHPPAGVRVAFSREKELLDTGGGLKNAAAFFDDGEPFFIHNVDVLSDIDLGAMARAHQGSDALVTLAVQERASGRQLLFDDKDNLRGRLPGAGAPPEWAGQPVHGALARAFCGIHVASPALLPRISESGIFPIMRSYIRLAAEGAFLRAFDVSHSQWQDIGSTEKLEIARRKFLT